MVVFSLLGLKSAFCIYYAYAYPGEKHEGRESLKKLVLGHSLSIFIQVLKLKKKKIGKKSHSNWHSNNERYFDPPGDTESKVQTNVIATTSEKAENLTGRLIKARDNTGVGLIIIRTIKN